MSQKNLKKWIKNLIEKLHSITHDSIQFDKDYNLNYSQTEFLKYVIELIKEKIVECYKYRAMKEGKSISKKDLDNIKIYIKEFPPQKSECLGIYEHDKKFFLIKIRKIYINANLVRSALQDDLYDSQTLEPNESFMELIRTIAHEYAHAAQDLIYDNYDKEYEFYLQLLGYEKNPYEEEARIVASAITYELIFKRKR